MSRNLKHSESVERYLSGVMNSAEQKVFEKEVAMNPELAAELRLSRSIDEAMKREDILDFRAKLLAGRYGSSQHGQSVKVVSLRRKRYWYAAASVIILAVLGTTLYWNISSHSSNEALFRQYYTPENLIQVTRSADANIVEAIIKFQEKDYSKASFLFSQILKHDTANYAGWFYYGISNIETKNYPEAEKAFKLVITDQDNLYIEHAEWYLALCYLKSDQLNKARQQLSLVANNPENFHRREARHLLTKLVK